MNIWSEIVKIFFTFIVRHYFSLQAEYYRILEIKEYHKDPNGETHPFCCKRKMQRSLQSERARSGTKGQPQWGVGAGKPSSLQLPSYTASLKFLEPISW